MLYLFCNNGLHIAILHGKIFVDFVDFVKAQVATACLEDVQCMYENHALAYVRQKADFISLVFWVNFGPKMTFFQKRPKIGPKRSQNTQKTKKIKNRKRLLFLYSYDLVLCVISEKLMHLVKSLSVFSRFFGNFPYKSLYFRRFLRAYHPTLTRHQNSTGQNQKLCEPILKSQ